VRREVTQFAVALSNQSEVGGAVLSDWLQPRRTGSLHGALGSDERRNEVR